MHFDFAHATVAAILMLGTLKVLETIGLTQDMSHGKGMATTFVSILVIIFNFVRPFAAGLTAQTLPLK